MSTVHNGYTIEFNQKPFVAGEIINEIEQDD